MSGFYSPQRYAMRRQRRADIKRTLGQAWGALGGLGGIVKAARGGIPGITGSGDYTVSYNSLMEDGSSQAPSFGGGTGRSIRVRHREYIQDVQSTIGFANLSFAINPANRNLFPWLSNIAQNFQEYKIHGMIMHFNSLSAEALNSTNTALGAIIMSTDYNAASPPFQSKSAAENAEFTVSTRPSQSLIHGIECDPAMTVNQGHLYISANSNGTVPTGEDIKTYNMGTFQFITQGSQAVATVGELWVSYDIELLKPTDTASLYNSVADHWQLNNVSPGGSGAGFLFGVTRNPQMSSIGGFVTSLIATSSYTFPTGVIPGQIFQIILSIVGSSTAVMTYPTITLANCTAVNCLQGDSLSRSGCTATDSTNSTDYTLILFVKIAPTASVQARAVVTLSAASTPSSASGDLFVIQVPGNLT